MTKNNLERKVLTLITFPHHGSSLMKSDQGFGSQRCCRAVCVHVHVCFYVRVCAHVRACMCVAYWLAPHGLLSLLFYTHTHTHSGYHTQIGNGHTYMIIMRTGWGWSIHSCCYLWNQSLHLWLLILLSTFPLLLAKNLGCLVSFISRVAQILIPKDVNY